MSYAAALADVKARVAKSRTSFNAGMAILPKERREAMYALYAFCREVDDIADDGATQTIRDEGLASWRARIGDLFQRRVAEDSITQALLPAVDAFGLVEADFQAIIDGMAMDAGEPILAPAMAMLDLYCDRVASAVGRASVRIFGDASANGMLVAHHLGRALQLTNILRDVAEDAARGRLYLPRELLATHNAAMEPHALLADAALRPVCRDLAAVAREHFRQADAAMATALPRAMKPARIMRTYYGAIFDRLVAADWRDPTMRVSLPRWRKLWLAIRAMTG